MSSRYIEFIASFRKSPGAGILPQLEPGDHLDKKTFHAATKPCRRNAVTRIIGGVRRFLAVPLKR